MASPDSNDSPERQLGMGPDKTITRREAERYADRYPILRRMLEDDAPLSRDVYIEADYLGEPDEWTAENEMMLPPPFRHHE